MGADGGTIPKRCELVKGKKKKEKVDKNVKNASRWRICRLSQQPLKRPIVACRLGGLYNKEAVLDAILTKKIGESENAKHIRGLKDIKELKLKDNPEYKESGADKGDVYKDHNVSPFCCPVTGLEMNGNHTFTVNWHCGCVISEKAISTVKGEVHECLGCAGPYKMDDIIVLNPDEDLRRVYEERLQEERKARKIMKAGKGSKEAEKIGPHAAKMEAGGSERKALKRKVEDCPSSIQNDAKASATYKSLFTTCEAAKKKPQSHWITYNPLYY